MREQWFQLIMGDENRVENSFFADSDRLFGIDPVDYTLEQGNRIAEWDSRSYFKSTCVDHDGNFDSILCNASMIPVFSMELQSTMKHAGIGVKDVQWLPVRILNSKNKEFTGYSIANITTRLIALDRENCVMLMENEEIDSRTMKPKAREFLQQPCIQKQSKDMTFFD